MIDFEPDFDRVAVLADTPPVDAAGDEGEPAVTVANRRLELAPGMANRYTNTGVTLFETDRDALFSGGGRRVDHGVGDEFAQGQHDALPARMPRCPGLHQATTACGSPEVAVEVVFRMSHVWTLVPIDSGPSFAWAAVSQIPDVSFSSMMCRPSLDT